ncbi:MAG TPA: winged helix DNA-binding domain-containing protein [Actinomycetota bacterium]
MLEVDRDQVLAYRLAAHHLTERLGPRSLVKAAVPVGVQETPTGTAALAFAARVDGLTLEALDRALRVRRTLLTIWSMRGAPHVVPAADLEVFTLGALPVDAASFRQSMGGWSDALDAAELDVHETLDEMAAAARDLLDGRTMNVNELRDLVRERVPALAKVRKPEFARDPMPEPMFRALGTAGAVCIVSGRGTDSEMGRTDQWLGSSPVPDSTEKARAELARRYLHAYGPSTPRHFAEWTGRSTEDAKQAFSLIEGELEEVSFGGRSWMLRRDAKALSSPSEPRGVRLLPVQDPYLQQRDRTTLLADAARRKRLWQPIRGPGGVLSGGDIVATWRSTIKGRRLEVTVEPFGRLAGTVREQVAVEAELAATIRGCETVRLTFGG